MEKKETNSDCLKSKAITWVYRYLPMLLGCHCRADRSFFYKGRKFPVCARCTGECAGFLLALSTFWICHPPVPIPFILMIPMIVDGTVQQRTRYESTNSRRFFTGLLFGYGAMLLVILSYAAVLKYGFRLGRKWKMRMGTGRCRNLIRFAVQAALIQIIYT